jgi:alkyl hydroperoxide reductase subunit AhpC
MQLPALNSDLETFAGLNAQVLDISVDSISSHVAWQQQEIGTIDFPMCSDFFPHAGVTQEYGVLREAPPVPGISERAAFIVDRNGKIAFAKLYPLDQTPDKEELLVALQKIEGQHQAIPQPSP